MTKPTLLILDDERHWLDMLANSMRNQGFRCYAMQCAKKAIDTLQDDRSIQLALIDEILWVPDRQNGEEELQRWQGSGVIREVYPVWKDVKFIIVTAIPRRCCDSIQDLKDQGCEVKTFLKDQFQVDPTWMLDSLREAPIQITIQGVPITMNNNFNNPEVVQIIDTNNGKVVGKEYASSPEQTDLIKELLQVLQQLNQRHPNATEAEANEIIEAEFEEIRQQHPQRWQTFQKQLLNPERWLQGGKAALIKAAEHFTEQSIIGKAGLAFLDEFSKDSKNDETDQVS